ncbi:acylphosphatase [Candidatus Persebacteraceae bacterium Df01]|jgi:acylphosphatase|uniref:acylphosphatase n=1 Tax=Candidatus Doriopsillibacter californiensis TaxID=2970740 RepID=A0ABT7QMB9_9GAMM|nr:acylphosphatase [Candidatus Persebacteraceae bacterium Df01]
MKKSIGQETEQILTTKYRLTGSVQNVGFRYFLAQKAKQLSVCGWGKNENDGSLIVLFSGEREAVRKMLECAQNGPPSAVVSNFVELIVEDGDIPNENNFEQR